MWVLTDSLHLALRVSWEPAPDCSKEGSGEKGGAIHGGVEWL